jgi:hypothetical protein
MLAVSPDFPIPSQSAQQFTTKEDLDVIKKPTKSSSFRRESRRRQTVTSGEPRAVFDSQFYSLKQFELPTVGSVTVHDMIPNPDYCEKGLVSLTCEPDDTWVTSAIVLLMSMEGLKNFLINAQFS